MIGLLDVNVLIALLDSLHPFHDTSWDWFDTHRSEGWATCPLTENGFVRIVGGPRYANSGGTTEKVAALLRQLTDAPDHCFWPDDISLLDSARFEPAARMSPRRLTDSYLLGLAVRNNAKLITLDQRFSHAGIVGGANALTIIPTGHASSSMSQ